MLFEKPAKTAMLKGTVKRPLLRYKKYMRLQVHTIRFTAGTDVSAVLCASIIKDCCILTAFYYVFFLGSLPLNIAPKRSPFMVSDSHFVSITLGIPADMFFHSSIHISRGESVPPSFNKLTDITAHI